VPKALPLHHPTASELRAAHDTYVANEKRDYVYRVARRMLDGAGEGAGCTAAEAIVLLLQVWNGRSKYTRALELDAIAALLEQTAEARRVFEHRNIASVAPDELPQIEGIYADFHPLFGGVGAAKALGLLHPRVFPLWDTAIGKAYIGYKWSEPELQPAHYGTFAGLCSEQCTVAVSEEEFGRTLLKTLDEWNFSVWTKGWIPRPGVAP
jgi:hypothetical protein